MKEITINQKRKNIIHKIIQQLSNQNIDLYYESTSNTASAIVEYISLNKDQLNKDDLELIKELDERQISLMLSLNS